MGALLCVEEIVQERKIVKLLVTHSVVENTMVRTFGFFIFIFPFHYMLYWACISCFNSSPRRVNTVIVINMKILSSIFQVSEA